MSKPILKSNLNVQETNNFLKMNTIKYFKYLIIISFLILLILPFVVFTNKCTVQAIDKDVAWVYGTITDTATGDPAINYTVEIKGPIFKGNTTTTDKKGFYSLFVPSGDLIITMYHNKGIYHPPFEFNIESGKSKQIDLEIDSRSGLHKLFGYIYDAGLNITAIGYRVNATIDNIEYGSSVTDHLGYYELILYPGIYKFSISINEVVYCEEEVTLLNNDLVHNKTINEKVKEKKIALPMIDINQVINDISDHWYLFVLLIIICILIPIILIFYDKFFDKVLTKKRKFFDERSLLIIKK